MAPGVSGRVSLPVAGAGQPGTIDIGGRRLKAAPAIAGAALTASAAAGGVAMLALHRAGRHIPMGAIGGAALAGVAGLGALALFTGVDPKKSAAPDAPPATIPM